MLYFATVRPVRCLCPVVAAMFLFLSPAWFAALFAQQPPTAGQPESQARPSDGARQSQPKHGSAHHHRHEAAVFLGGSTEKGVRGLTTGGEYELRLHRLVGVGAVGEYAGGGLRESAFAFPVTFHPYRGVRLSAGPGFVRSLSHHGPDGSESGAASGHSTEGSETETKAFLRFGLGYDIPIVGSFTICPGVAVDVLAREEVLVFGISFVFGF